MSFIPGVNHALAPELDIGFGIEVRVGGPRKVTPTVQIPMADKDGDGIPDDKDKCPDRAEDKDGFEDQDGCPDIDNDNDRVLDIADKCPNVPETYNGYQDEDGCPDTVPPDLDTLKGTVEGLIYADGETVVRDSAQPAMKKIAELLAKYPSVKIVLIGHTDDREAKQFAQRPTQQLDIPCRRLASAATFGARAPTRCASSSVRPGDAGGRPRAGSRACVLDEPVADNDSPQGRLANRRVELQTILSTGTTQRLDRPSPERGALAAGRRRIT